MIVDSEKGVLFRKNVAILTRQFSDAEEEKISTGINHPFVFGCEGTFGFLFHHIAGRFDLGRYSGTSL